MESSGTRMAGSRGRSPRIFSAPRGNHGRAGWSGRSSSEFRSRRRRAAALPSNAAHVLLEPRDAGAPVGAIHELAGMSTWPRPRGPCTCRSGDAIVVLAYGNIAATLKDRKQKRAARMFRLPVLVGGGEGARTPDLRAASASLSQLSYAPLGWVQPRAAGRAGAVSYNEREGASRPSCTALGPG